MSLIALLAEPPLDPTGAEGRSLLRRELVKSEYADQEYVSRFIAWVQETVLRAVDAASNTPPLLFVFGLVIFMAVVVATIFLFTRPQRSARARARDGHAVFADGRRTATEHRKSAEIAFAAGQWDVVVLEGFRAAALRQIETGRLDDIPGATAKEVASAVAGEFPWLGAEVSQASATFDLIAYGHREAMHQQAVGILALDDSLASAR